jgi:hypothetical protein
MIPGGWAELATWQRIAQLSREGEHERVSHIVRSKRRGGSARRARTLMWRDMAGFIASRMRLPRGSPRGGLEFPMRGERS